MVNRLFLLLIGWIVEILIPFKPLLGIWRGDVLAGPPRKKALIVAYCEFRLFKFIWQLKFPGLINHILLGRGFEQICLIYVYAPRGPLCRDHLKLVEFVYIIHFLRKVTHLWRIVSILVCNDKWRYFFKMPIFENLNGWIFQIFFQIDLLITHKLFLLLLVVQLEVLHYFLLDALLKLIFSDDI